MPKKTRSTKVGRVVSNGMDKSVVVAVDRRFQHALYGKTIRRTSKFMAHDEENACQVGDKVTKALGAVSRITDRGNRVVFEQTHGFIQNKANGECTYFDRKDDVYVLETLVRPPSVLFPRPS